MLRILRCGVGDLKVMFDSNSDRKIKLWLTLNGTLNVLVEIAALQGM